MSDTISQQYRQLAEECRKRALTLSDPNARTRMLDIAAEYERKCKKTETRIGAREAEKTTPSIPVIAATDVRDVTDADERSQDN